MPEMKIIPFDSIVKIKTKEEIAIQMVKEFLIAHKALNRLEGISDIEYQNFITTVLKFQPEANVLEVLFKISKGKVGDISLNQLAFLYERSTFPVPSFIFKISAEIISPGLNSSEGFAFSS